MAEATATVAPQISGRSSPDDATNFLTRVRTGRGLICAHSSSMGWRERRFDNPEQAVELLDQFRGSCNVYVSMGTLAPDATSRSAENVQSLSGFFLDLDCHGKPGEYESPREAAKALQAFCASAGIAKPSYVVTSGHGLHVHWLLSHPVPRLQWQRAATKLKELTHLRRLKADKAVTADPARVLRVPGTLNYRDAQKPVPVELIALSGKAVELDAFEAALDDALCAVGPDTKVVRNPGSAKPTSPLQTMLASAPAVHDNPENAARVRDMVSVLDPDCEYPFWRDTVWAIRASGLSDARDIAEDWSKAGAKWKAQAFQRVWDNYDPCRAGSIGFGTLVQRARADGYW